MKPYQLAFLESSLVSGRLSHAYVFSGPRRALKEEVLVEFFQILMSDGCQRCAVCRQLAVLQHPDITLVEPEVLEGSSRISIDQVRELKRLFSLASYGGGYKVAVLRRADLMAQDAQSALLKLLEEPTGRTLLILLADHEDLLLGTLRSRTQELRFAGRGEIEPSTQVPEGSLRVRFLKAKEIGEADVIAQEEALRSLALEAHSRLASLRDTQRALLLASKTLRAEEAFARGRASFRMALEQAYMEL